MRRYLTKQYELGKIEITCDFCGRQCAILESGFEEVPQRVKGINDGEHRCFTCKKSFERAYDDHVDPLHFYH